MKRVARFQPLSDLTSYAFRPTHGALLLEIVVLAGLPLLSRAAFVGAADGAMWPELLAVPVWIAALLAGVSAWSQAGRGIWPSFGLYFAAIVSGVVIVLLQEHRLDSPVFVANLTDAATRWFGPWSNSDSLFPIRSAVIYVAGPLFFVAVRSIWRADRKPRLFEGLILSAGALAACIAIIQAVTGRGLVSDAILGESMVSRAPGPLPDPNAFASFLALVAAFGAVTWNARVRSSTGDARKQKIFVAGVWAVLIAAGLWVSGSRSALLALTLLLGVSLVVRLAGSQAPGLSHKRFAAAILAIAVLLVGFVAAATLGSFAAVPDQTRLHRYLSVFDLGQPSMHLLRGRPPLWKAGTTMVVDEPVTGVGAGRYGVELAGHVRPDLWGVATAENAHNYYLQVAAELGLIGVSGLVLMLAIAVGALWRNRADSRSRAALFGVGAWCLTCLAGHPQLIPTLQLFFWGFLGMACAGLRLPRFSPWTTLSVVFLLLLAGRIGQEAAGGGYGPALYTAGLHEREDSAPGQETLRWTTERTDIDFRREGKVVEIRFFVAHDELPVTVRATVETWNEERHFFTGGWKTLAYYLPGSMRNRVSIALGVSPLFVAPGDSRRLGVMLAPLRWYPEPPREPLGAYPLEEDADGRQFRWTAGVSCLPLATLDEIDIELRADNPDLEERPLNVTLVRGEASHKDVVIPDRAWQSVRLPAGSGEADVLCVQTDRTWNPRLDLDQPDVRDLGVAVALGAAELQR